MAELAEAGITFSRVPPHRADEVMTLLWDHFIPHEPLSRSLNITESKPGTLQNYLIEMLFKDAIKTGKSVMAEKDGKIVGVRVAEVLERTGWARWCTDKIFDLVVDYGLIWLFDRKLHRICKINKLLISKWLGYNVWNTFNTYNCDKVLSAICLCSVNSGIRGVGTELVKQSEELGREEGCAMTSVVVTGQLFQLFHSPVLIFSAPSLLLLFCKI